MTEEQSRDPWWKQIIRVRKLTSPVWDIIREFNKWFFDLIKNVMVASAITYTGKKTGSLSIIVIGYIASILISSYFISYIAMWMPDIFTFKKGNRHVAYDIAFGLLSGGIVFALIQEGSALINSVITELIAAQAK
jgi:hypothetical protein